MDPFPCSQANEPDDGVDVTLIRWFLTLTSAERLEALENFVNDVLELRYANRSIWPNPRDTRQA